MKSSFPLLAVIYEKVLNTHNGRSITNLILLVVVFSPKSQQRQHIFPIARLF